MNKNFIQRYLSNIRLIFFAYLFLLIGGILALINLPRELMPSVDFPIIIASVTLPGASPHDIEDLITIPLEDQLKSLKDLKTLSSSSMENMSIVIAEFENKLSVDDYLSAVQRVINEIKLPTDALKPMVHKINFDETPVWTFSIQGHDPKGLNLVAEALEKELEKDSLIDRVEISGLNEREIVVLINPEQLASLNLHPALLAQMINLATSHLPAGDLNIGSLNYSVGLNKSITDLKSLQQMPLLLNGKFYHLGEITEIYEQEKADTNSAFQITPQKEIGSVMTFNVYKSTGAPIDQTTKVAHQITQRVMATYPQFVLKNIFDYGQEIASTFQDLGINIIETIALVFLVMLIFLGIREATISALSIPLAMLLTFTGMSFFNLSLNFISLFALLLVLGMLVDNAIVVTTALSRTYKKNHLSALKAGVVVWQEYFIALISTNLTTVWAFLPLLLMGGIMGQFLKPISLVVAIAIIGSALIAFLLTLPLGIFVLEFHLPTRVQKLLFGSLIIISLGLFIYFFPKNIYLLISLPAVILILYLIFLLWFKSKKFMQKKDQNRKNSWFSYLITGFIKTDRLEHHYRLILDKILAKRQLCRQILLAIIILTIFSFSLLALGQIPSEFFPKSNADLLELELALPLGTNQTTTRDLAQEILPQLNTFPDIDYITAQTGRGNSAQIVSGSSNNHKILFTFNLLPKKQRQYTSTQIAQMIREKWQNNQYGESLIIEASAGPPAGADLQLSLAGDEIEILLTYSQRLSEWLKNQAGVKDVHLDISQASKKLVFIPQEEILVSYNLSKYDIALALRSYLSGATLGYLHQDDKEIEIILRQQKNLPQIEDLNKIALPLTPTETIPLLNLGHLELRPNPSHIMRQDGKRLITLSASVEANYSATAIGKKLLAYAQNELELPAGYQPLVGGVNEQNDISMAGLRLAMIVASFLILATLVLQLQSFRKAFIVMSVIPVAISGVFINFALLGLTLSLPAVIGVLALFGIVVNNSILIVERINQNLQAGKSFNSAIVTACGARLQPILLTSLTTIIGLLPVTFSDPIWQGLGGAIIAGLTFSGALLLFYIPALYYIMFEPNKLAQQAQKWQKFLTHFQTEN